MAPRNKVYAAVVFSLLLVFLMLAFFGWASKTVAESAAQANQVESTPSALRNPLDPNDQELPRAPEAPGESDAPQAGSSYLHVSGSTFDPLWSTASITYAGSGCVYMGGTNLYLNAPLELPYKSTVTQLRLYYKDTSASNGTMWLAEYDDGLDYTYIVTTTTSGSSGWGSISVNITKTLDYDNYSYVVLWSSSGVTGSSMQLCGYRVRYTAPVIFGVAMPVIKK